MILAFESTGFAGCADTEGAAGDEFFDGCRRNMRFLGLGGATGVWNLQAAVPHLLDARCVGIGAEAGFQRWSARLNWSGRDLMWSGWGCRRLSAALHLQQLLRDHLGR